MADTQSHKAAWELRDEKVFRSFKSAKRFLLSIHRRQFIVVDVAVGYKASQLERIVASDYNHLGGSVALDDLDSQLYGVPLTYIVDTDADPDDPYYLFTTCFVVASTKSGHVQILLRGA